MILPTLVRFWRIALEALRLKRSVTYDNRSSLTALDNGVESDSSLLLLLIGYLHHVLAHTESNLMTNFNAFCFAVSFAFSQTILFLLAALTLLR